MEVNRPLRIPRYWTNLMRDRTTTIAILKTYDFDRLDKEGHTVLHAAILCSRKKVINYLLSLRPIPHLNTISTNLLCRKTPLGCALHRTHPSLALRLINCGADTTLPDSYLNTPLHYAAQNGHYSLVTLLVASEVDIDPLNQFWETPTSLACKNRYPETVSFLISNGADAIAEDMWKQTSFDVAVKLKHTRLQELLSLFVNDEFTRCVVDLNDIVNVAKMQQHIGGEIAYFDEYLGKIDGVSYDYVSAWRDVIDTFKRIFLLQPQYFRRLVTKFPEIFECYFRYYTLETFQISRYDLFDKPHFLENLMLLMENSCLSNEKVTYLAESLRSAQVPLQTVTKTICHFLSYGGPVFRDDLNCIFILYGYCELFKLLLHMDILFEGYVLPVYQTWRSYNRYYTKQITPCLFYDLETSIDRFCRYPNFYGQETWEDLLEYSAHPKVKSLCLEDRRTRTKASKLPAVQTLVEIARNAARTHLIDVFKITKLSDYYKLLKKLPISNDHVKILTMERKLYNVT